ncbi:hypothetical protein GUJ93_ZPchr0010g7444 [Zizania palustris]|uniref:Uncharacterized protein n=1 Tax=Zizania palustris TaxID=103762 RepID=A0A8J5WFP8_ZIZPA|nr:hypothetical protein GUJ93_ZPchr0010g7444 [Zizania palustris]
MAATASSDRASECPHLAQRLSPPLICHTFKGMLSDNGEDGDGCCSTAHDANLVEQLERELFGLRQALLDKQEQEQAMLY